MHLAFADSGINRKTFFKKQNLSGRKVYSAELVHGVRVHRISSGDENIILAQTDALITGEKNVILTVTVADCFPVYFFDPIKLIIGIAHCGWRGIVGNLASKTIGAMHSKPSDVLVGIGPGIQPCHFEVQADVLPRFQEYPEEILHRDNKIFVDLPAIISKQLTDIGVKKIETSGECTCHNHQKYFSFRRDKPKAIEAMVAYIGLLP